MDISYKPQKRLRRKIIAVSILSVLILYIAAGVIITNITMSRYFARSDKRAYFSSALAYDDVMTELPRNEITFYSGSNELTGAVYGSADAKGLIVIIHGYGGNMDSYIPQIQYFVQHDWRVLAYDGTGINDSGGESRDNLYQAVADLRSALTYLKSDAEFNGLPIVLFGHSQGGFAACAVLNYEESSDVKAVVSFAGMNNAGDMIDVYGKNIAGVFYPLLKPFVYFTDYMDFSVGSDKNAVSGINSTDIHVMLVQGAEDTTVPPSIAITNFMEEINNPNVETIILTDEWNNNHNSMLWSRDAYEYRAEVNATLETYRAANGIEVFTDEGLHAWAAEIQMDRSRHNALDVILFDRIDTFLHNVIRQ